MTDLQTNNANPFSVLIVEDDKYLQEILQQRFKTAGYKLWMTDRGDMGLSLAREHNPDVILLDLMLANLNGIEVLEQLKGGQITQHIPVVIVTNMDSSMTKARAIEKGADLFLPKYLFTPVEIEQKVWNLLNPVNAQDGSLTPTK